MRARASRSHLRTPSTRYVESWYKCAKKGENTSLRQHAQLAAMSWTPDATDWGILLQRLSHSPPSTMTDEILPSRPASLRDLYSPPPTDWSFNPVSSPGSSANGGSSSSAWSSRAPPPKPRVLELSPYPYDEPGGAGEYIFDTRSMIKVLIGNALLQYATTGIAMPFEVAKILMQCQWVPREVPREELEEVIIEVPEEADQDSVQSPFYIGCHIV